MTSKLQLIAAMKVLEEAVKEEGEKRDDKSREALARAHARLRKLLDSAVEA